MQECDNRPATMSKSFGFHAFSLGNIKQLDNVGWSSTSHGPPNLKIVNLNTLELA